jgi:hypothetical protein
MKRFFHLALLIGALFGLIGQGAAIAMSPNCSAMMDMPAMAQSAKAISIASGQMDCCPKAAPAKHDSTPSKDMMQGCLMMSGCFMSLAVDNTPALSAHVALKPVAAIWPLATQLSGRSVPPEQRPPSIQS